MTLLGLLHINVLPESLSTGRMAINGGGTYSRRPRHAYALSKHHFLTHFSTSRLLSLLTLFFTIGTATAAARPDDGTTEPDTAHKVFYYRIVANCHPDGAGGAMVSNGTAIFDHGDAPLDTLFGITVPKSQNTAYQYKMFLYGVPNNGFYVSKITTGGYEQQLIGDHTVATLLSINEDPSNPATFYYEVYFDSLNVYLGEANQQFGYTEISKVRNEIGDTVTLTAHPYEGGFVNAKFTCWKDKDGNTVSTANPYTFVVTEANRGRYEAEYTGRDVSKGVYCMAYNQADDGDAYLGLFGAADSLDFDNRYPVNSVMTATGEAVHSSPAFVFKVKGRPSYDGSLIGGTFEAQGKYLSEAVGGTRGHITVATNGTTPGFTINGGFGTFIPSYIINDGTHTAGVEGFGTVGVPDMSFSSPSWDSTDGSWQIADITADDDTEAYFGAMPAETSKIGNRYYTTMYTAFPYQCLDSVRAYTVSAINDDGSVQLDIVESDTVPAYTPVILACKTTEPRHNRLLPLTDEPSPLTGTNLLKGELWLKGYKQQESDYRAAFDPQTMRVLSADGAKFGSTNNSIILADGTTGISPYIANNTAYLDISGITNPRETYTLFKDTPTGISEEVRVKSEESNTRAKGIYSITGQYLGSDINHLPKGIYILNGKKIIR